jgi:hypothetical protein
MSVGMNFPSRLLRLAATVIARMQHALARRGMPVVAEDDAWDFAEIARNTREANSYGYWKDRPVMNDGITREVLKDRSWPFEQLRSRDRQDRQDAPDCEAIVNGWRTGIELTELMHQQTLEANIKTNKRFPLSPGIPLWKQPNLLVRLRGQRFHIWDQATLRAKVQSLIDEKDIPPEELKGGPYDRYFLIIHTAEGALGKDNVEAFLQDAVFESRWIANAYLWLPPPFEKQMPFVFELKLTPRDVHRAQATVHRRLPTHRSR